MCPLVQARTRQDPEDCALHGGDAERLLDRRSGAHSVHRSPPYLPLPLGGVTWWATQSAGGL